MKTMWLTIGAMWGVVLVLMLGQWLKQQRTEREAYIELNPERLYQFVRMDRHRRQRGDDELGGI